MSLSRYFSLYTDPFVRISGAGHTSTYHWPARCAETCYGDHHYTCGCVSKADAQVGHRADAQTELWIGLVLLTLGIIALVIPCGPSPSPYDRAYDQPVRFRTPAWLYPVTKLLPLVAGLGLVLYVLTFDMNRYWNGCGQRRWF